MVTRMLEKAIEIEGLLRIIRDGKPQPETYALLQRKAKELANATQSMEYQMPNHESALPTNEEQTMTDADQALGKESAASETTLIVIDKAGSVIIDPTEAKSGIKPILIDMTETPKEEAIEKDVHEELSEVEEEDVEEEIEANPNEEPSSEEDTTEEDKDEVAIPEPEPEEPAATPNEETDEEDDILLSLDEDEESSEEIPDEDGETIIHIIDEEDALIEAGGEEPDIEIHAGTPDIEIITKNEEDIKERPSIKKQSKLKSAFSLNDRFLYSRELFNGNMKIFDSTIEHIEGIGDYSVAEDYFYNELEWDREKPEVASFMEIIKLKM